MTRASGNDRGKVFLIGAGPGDPGLITVRGAQCLAESDLVLYDYLVNPAFARLRAGVGPAGVSGSSARRPRNASAGGQPPHGRRRGEGKNVARLKSGDPHLFGRGRKRSRCWLPRAFPTKSCPA